MPLPVLRADGMLPPGIHRATLDAVFAAFPAVTPKRQALNDALSHCVATVKRLRLGDDIGLDGSYTTSNLTPSDADLVVLTPRIYQFAGEHQYAAEGIDVNLLDIQFAQDAVGFQGGLTFFSTARSGQAKGVIALFF